MKLLHSASGSGNAKFIHKDPLLAGKIILSGESGSGIFGADGTSIVDEDYNIDAPITSSDLTLSGTLTVTGASTLNGATQISNTVTVGVDDTGYDVKLFGATAGSYMLWDESADKLIVNAGTADLGTSCEADAYTVGGVAGADFNGAVTNLTAVKGIVTAAS